MTSSNRFNPNPNIGEMGRSGHSRGGPPALVFLSFRRLGTFPIWGELQSLCRDWGWSLLRALDDPMPGSEAGELGG